MDLEIQIQNFHLLIEREGLNQAIPGITNCSAGCRQSKIDLIRKWIVVIMGGNNRVLIQITSSSGLIGKIDHAANNVLYFRYWYIFCCQGPDERCETSSIRRIQMDHTLNPGMQLRIGSDLSDLYLWKRNQRLWCTNNFLMMKRLRLKSYNGGIKTFLWLLKSPEHLSKSKTSTLWSAPIVGKAFFPSEENTVVGLKPFLTMIQSPEFVEKRSIWRNRNSTKSFLLLRWHMLTTNHDHSHV